MIIIIEVGNEGVNIVNLIVIELLFLLTGRFSIFGIGNDNLLVRWPEVEIVMLCPHKEVA